MFFSLWQNNQENSYGSHKGWAHVVIYSESKYNFVTGPDRSATPRDKPPNQLRNRWREPRKNTNPFNSPSGRIITQIHYLYRTEYFFQQLINSVIVQKSVFVFNNHSFVQHFFNISFFSTVFCIVLCIPTLYRESCMWASKAESFLTGNAQRSCGSGITGACRLPELHRPFPCVATWDLHVGLQRGLPPPMPAPSRLELWGDPEPFRRVFMVNM